MRSGPWQCGRVEVKVANQVAASPAGESSVGKLAQFFPDAIAVRIPVRVTGLGSHGAVPTENALQENTVIEFGTPEEVLFASSLPLEFEDRVRLESADGSLQAEASVVAVQYHNGRTAVAARFVRAIANWIIKR
jgi:hypothetical protein